VLFNFKIFFTKNPRVEYVFMIYSITSFKIPINNNSTVLTKNAFLTAGTADPGGLSFYQASLSHRARFLRQFQWLAGQTGKTK
jgi:hypothetical protein